MVLIMTGFTVLATVLFNLISDLIGGVRVTVIQEESASGVVDGAAITLDDGVGLGYSGYRVATGELRRYRCAPLRGYSSVG